jgi:SAM-dependent methyltransferase
MHRVQPELVGHPDRLRWNARYQGGFVASFTAHPLAVRALSMRLPAGPVLDLASGPSGSVLLAAGIGRQVTAVDASEVALDLLGEEAERRGLRALITLVHADLKVWRPQPDSYSLVLCTGYWDRSAFAAAAASAAVDGLLGWEAFTAEARRERPHLPAEWCLDTGEPATLLPSGYAIVEQHDLPDGDAATKRQLLARRLAAPVP